MSEWLTNAHSVSRDNEAITKITIWSAEDRAPSSVAYHTVQVAIGTQDGKRDVIGTYNGSKDRLNANSVREIYTGLRQMRPGETLLVIASNTGSPVNDAAGMTVEMTLQLVGGSGYQQLFQTSGYIGDQRTREAVEGLNQRLNTSGVTEWTISVPVRDPQDSLGDSITASICQGRLSVKSTTAIQLTRYTGTAVMVNGQMMSIPETGLEISSTARTIISGPSLSDAPTASTLYGVYLASPSAPFRSSSIILGPSAFVRANGVPSLGASGKDVEYRFLGWVRTNASTQFVDSETARHLVNYYNRQRAHLFTCPKYTNDNAFTSYTTTSGTWVKANGGTGSTVSYIANGEDTVTLGLFSMCENSSSTSAAYAGIGDNSATVAYVSAYSGKNAAVTVACQMANNPSAGYREAHLLIRSRTAGTTSTYYADLQRGSDTEDPRATALYGIIMA